MPTMAHEAAGQGTTNQIVPRMLTGGVNVAENITIDGNHCTQSHHIDRASDS